MSLDTSVPPSGFFAAINDTILRTASARGKFNRETRFLEFSKRNNLLENENRDEVEKRQFLFFFFLV